MQEALTALLLGSTAVRAVLDDRLTWDVIPQGEQDPCAVLYLITDLPDYVMTGVSGMVFSRVQIDCRALDPTTALTAARAVESALSGFRGVQGAVRFDGIFKDGGRSDFADIGAQRFFRVSADYLIHSNAA